MQPKQIEATQRRSDTSHVLLRGGELTAAQLIENLPEILTQNVERDPVRGGVLS